MEFSVGKISAKEARSNERTPFHIEISFASGIYSLNRFRLLLPVIIDVARNLLAEQLQGAVRIALGEAEG